MGLCQEFWSPQISDANSPDAPGATALPAGCSPGCGSNPGWRSCATSAPGWPLCWPADNRLWGNKPGDNRCGNRARTTRYNNGTCADWSWNSSPLQSARKKTPIIPPNPATEEQKKEEGRIALEGMLRRKRSRKKIQFQTALTHP